MTPETTNSPSFVIGAQKAGTTTVHQVLEAAGANVARDKETQFFSADDRYERGLSWYDDQFDGTGSRVEVDPAYLLSPDAPRRIREAYGDRVRYVVVLRDPFDRARSHYRMMVARGVEHRSLVDALEDEIRAGQPMLYPDSARVGYLAGSQYLRLLGHWEATIPNAERLLLDFHALVVEENPAQWLRLGSFLNLEALTSSIPKANAAFSPRSSGLNRFIFDRESSPLIRRALHAVVPSEQVRERAAKYLYDKNRNQRNQQKADDDEQHARSLVTQHAGYGESDMRDLLGEVSWPSLQGRSQR